MILYIFLGLREFETEEKDGGGILTFSFQKNYFFRKSYKFGVLIYDTEKITNKKIQHQNVYFSIQI